tara:strand:+ start:491 stop:988 length:498 start_codon:yes stop_codon:yes gene_type:complete
MKKLLLYIALIICSFVQAQDYNSYLDQAKEAIKVGNFRKAYDSSTKAIELDAMAIEARETRIKSSLTASAPKERLESAITDLKFLIDKDIDLAVNYKLLGITESEIANFIYRFNRTVPNYQNDALSHYKNAVEAYQKAISLAPALAEELKYKVNTIKDKISELQS